MRWVSAVWRVLEANQAARRANEERSQRSRSRPVSFLSGDGSASTHYDPRRASLSPLPSSLPAIASPRTPAMTTDDQVITTSAGFAAPIVQRGSRRLAVGGLERVRSLRRVASEADLSDSAGTPSDLYRLSAADISSVPLTVGAARATNITRDFTFAGGIAPPRLDSPPPGYRSPNNDEFAARSSIYYTPQLGPSSTESLSDPSIALLSSSGSAYTAVPAPPYTSTSSMHTARQSSPALDILTSDILGVPSVSRQRSNMPGAYEYEDDASIGPSISERVAMHRNSVPAVAVTGPSPTSAVRNADSTIAVESFATARALSTSTSTLEPIYTATSRLGSPFETASERASRLSNLRQSTVEGSEASYDTAPPSPPSKYKTASLAPSIIDSEVTSAGPIRYQLHDPPVPSAYETAAGPSEKMQREAEYDGDDPTSSTSTRPLLTSSALSNATASASLYRTAPPKSASSFTTVPPIPITRSVTASEYQSWRSDDLERDDGTHVSEMTDLGLLADLERHSSSGSDVTRKDDRASVPPYSAAQNRSIPGSETLRTVYGTVGEQTWYETARTSTYITAPTWHTQSTYMTTAGGTQEYATRTTSASS